MKTISIADIKKQNLAQKLQNSAITLQNAFRNKTAINTFADMYVKKQFSMTDGERAKKIFNEYALKYPTSTDLSSTKLFNTSLDREQMKQDRIQRQEEERLKEEERNKKIQAYLKLKPVYLTETQLKPEEQNISKFKKHFNIKPN